MIICLIVSYHTAYHGSRAAPPFSEPEQSACRLLWSCGCIEIPADKINLEFVLGNKVMVGTVNANRDYFEQGVRDLSQAELEYPGWLKRLLTHPVKGLENYWELFEKLSTAQDAIKVFSKVAA